MNFRRLGSIGRTYRHIQRYSEILSVLFKFGFGDLVTSLRVEQYIDIGRRMIFQKSKERIKGITRAERLRLAVEELGPTFIKLGQMLSTRPDVLPADFVQELIKLQDNVQPFDFSEAEAIIESELEGRRAEIFSSIDEVPVAAASVGQVHQAWLHNGDKVVIKVQRPGIRRTIEVDLEILFHLATLMERHLEGMDAQRPTDMVEEFGHSLERELDYRIEAANMDRFAEIYQHEPRVRFPRVYRDASTSNLLTMEFMSGIKAGSLEELKRAGYDLARLADLGAELIMEQILVHGFFHADPHPGNILVLPGEVICLLDLGMTGRLDRRERGKHCGSGDGGGAPGFRGTRGSTAQTDHLG